MGLLTSLWGSLLSATLSFVLESPGENQNWARDHQPPILPICFLSNFYLILL